MKHRIALGALAIGMAACNDAPQVEIHTPHDGTLIEDHAAITFEVEVIDEALVGLELLLDGAPAPATVDPPFDPEEPTGCAGGCRFTLTWSGAEASEGGHELSVVALDEEGLEGDALVAMTFEDTPTATLSNPTSGDLVGVSSVNVSVGVVDRSAVDAEVRLDDVVQSGATVTGDCRFGCTVSWPWDTTPHTGVHDLAITVIDPYGRGTTVEQAVVVGDIPYATVIHVVNTSDTGGFSDLDIEIHLEDAETDAHIGCAGGSSGLEDVDDSGHRYEVMATFVDTTGARVAMSALEGRMIDIHVMEDDSFPCPGNLDVLTDDVVGVSPPMSGASLAGSAEMTFGNVAALQMNAGRPYQR